MRNAGMALVLFGLLAHGPVACCQPGLCIDPNLDIDAGTSSNDGGRSIQPTLTDIQAKIFTPSCATAGCHDSGSALVSGELDLSDGKSYAQLVNAPATTVSNETRVVPNSPQTSFLIVKLVLLWQSGAPTTFGGPMPPQGQLTSEQLQAIQDWIADGAQNN